MPQSHCQCSQHLLQLSPEQTVSDWCVTRQFEQHLYPPTAELLLWSPRDNFTLPDCGSHWASISSHIHYCVRDLLRAFLQCRHFATCSHLFLLFFCEKWIAVPPGYLLITRTLIFVFVDIVGYCHNTTFSGPPQNYMSETYQQRKPILQWMKTWCLAKAN